MTKQRRNISNRPSEEHHKPAVISQLPYWFAFQKASIGGIERVQTEQYAGAVAIIKAQTADGRLNSSARTAPLSRCASRLHPQPSH